ncbi:MAG: thymidine phosphorylase, partial [Chloroflexota bacterium]
MNPVDLIIKKRDGGQLTRKEIEWFVEAYSDDAIPDYQAAALLMAIFFSGMERSETVDLTEVMAGSGDQLDLHDLVPYVLDKHSSGGVGDKTTLVALPLVVASGHPVGKMSGRALGFTGGTLDKLESIPGWRAEISTEEFRRQLKGEGIVLCGQTADLAPADKKLYALRDVTGTVNSLPLIAASIMSKKLAAGADGIVLDVKVGSGAFMKTVEDAVQLARLMVDVAKDAGRSAVALISGMNQPLGVAVGNALEVKEAIATLNGHGPKDFTEHSLVVAAHMVSLARSESFSNELVRELSERLSDGSAWQVFRSMVAAQGGS